MPFCPPPVRETLLSALAAPPSPIDAPLPFCTPFSFARIWPQGLTTQAPLLVPVSISLPPASPSVPHTSQLNPHSHASILPLTPPFCGLPLTHEPSSERTTTLMPARLTRRRPSSTAVHLCNPIACRQCPAQFLSATQHAPATQPANRACCSTPPTCRCPVCLTGTPQHGPRQTRYVPAEALCQTTARSSPFSPCFFPANSSTFQFSLATIRFRWFLFHPLPLGTGFPNSMVISSKVKCAGAGKAPQ